MQILTQLCFPLVAPFFMNLYVFVPDAVAVNVISSPAQIVVLFEAKLTVLKSFAVTVLLVTVLLQPAALVAITFILPSVVVAVVL